MILWQKQASPAWLAENETRLQETRRGQPRAHRASGSRAHPGAGDLPSPAQSPRRLVRAFGGSHADSCRATGANSRQSRTHPPSNPSRTSSGNRERVGRLRRSAANRNSSFRPPALSAPANTRPPRCRFACSRKRRRKLPAGWRLLDAGTGTGILALAARRLGASRSSRPRQRSPRRGARAPERAAQSHCTGPLHRSRSVVGWKPSARYEVVTANLFSELLIAALPTFRRALRPNGCLIVSGILREQAESVIRALRATPSSSSEKQRRRGKWIALLAARKT